MGWGYYGFKPYVSVAERKAKAQRYAQKLVKQGRKLHPISIQGRQIAQSFWGQAWCDNLESYSDFANRLPRGRRYARNGSIVDLQIAGGKVTAIVAGSSIYNTEIRINPLAAKTWEKIKQDCSQSIDSLIDLLQGRFSQSVMQRLTRQKDGLFPQPQEISFKCSCPDWADLCKHSAAVLYGVGARLDSEPEMLFHLRKVDHLDLIAEAGDASSLDKALSSHGSGALEAENLSELFGIDLQASSLPPEKPKKRGAKRASQPAASKGAPESESERRSVRKKSVGKRSAKGKSEVATPKARSVRKRKK